MAKRGDSEEEILKVAAPLGKIVGRRGAPQSITADNGTDFASKAMDIWAYGNNVHLDFIRPGHTVENGYVESFNGKLRDVCLNVEVFFTPGQCPPQGVPLAR